MKSSLPFRPMIALTLAVLIGIGIVPIFAMASPGGLGEHVNIGWAIVVEHTPSEGGEPTYVADLEFVGTEPIVVVKQDESSTTTVTVKNTGNKSQDITFTITNISSGIWSTDISTATLGVAESVSFLVNFTPGAMDIGDYEGCYKAYSSEKTIESNFTLRVQLGPKSETSINVSLIEYRARMLELQADINQGIAAGINVTSAEVKFTELKNKIEHAESYVTEGKYLQAYELFGDIDVLFTETITELENAKAGEEKKGEWKFWVLIICIILGVVFLIYLFWPSRPGYKLKTGEYVYKPPKGKKIIPTVQRAKRIGVTPVRAVGKIRKKLKERKRKKEIEYEKIFEEEEK